MKRARMTGQAATRHRWRRELKTLWYHLRLAQPLLTGVAPLIAGLRRLQAALGNDHNLIVLEATLRGCPELRSMGAEIRHIGRLGGRMRKPLGRRAFELGRRIHTRKPAAFVKWLGASLKQRRSRRRAA